VNRDELAELLKQTLSTHTFADTTPTRDALVAALWPVLAEVWDEGFSEAERHDVERDTPIRNPYGEVKR